MATASRGPAAGAPRLAVGVDIGGTKIASGLVDGSGAVLRRLRVDTPPTDAEDVTGLVAELARKTWGDAGPLPVGVGAAGMIDLDGVVRFGPNLRWKDYPLRAQLAEQLSAPVTVENDGNVAAWGEYVAGAAARQPSVAPATSMAMFTIGTGVGGGYVHRGAMVRGDTGLGAEFGHIIVAEGGPLCGCGNRGCLEAVASGRAIGRLAQEAAEAGRIPPDSALADLTDLTGRSVGVAALGGDRFAVEVLARCGFWLGVGVASIVNTLDPSVVVVGGGAMAAGELLLAPAREAFEERILGRAHRAVPPVVAASLEADAGVVGAALLAMDPAARA